MDMSVERREGKVPVTILKLAGSLDGSNYRDVIALGEQLYQSGVRYLLADLAELTYISSAGLVALHRLALIMRGEVGAEPESGWGALKELGEEAGRGFQTNIKLLKPQPRVQRSLELVGFAQFLEIHTDLDTALASFGKSTV